MLWLLRLVREPFSEFLSLRFFDGRLELSHSSSLVLNLFRKNSSHTAYWFFDTNLSPIDRTNSSAVGLRDVTNRNGDKA